MTFADATTAKFHDHRGDEIAAVEFLQVAAGQGPALELAIGTGRIALPLAETGIQVDGIDFSHDMVERLRAKPGGKALAVEIADFADVSVEGQYALVYVVWNSFFNLLTQEDQVRCFANVAPRLRQDGVFVIEAYVPSYLHRMPANQQVAAESIEVDSVRIGALRHDPVEQKIEESHVTLSAQGIRLDPVVQRYAWPSELDLMAQSAGLTLLERWGGWQREPYDASSAAHVSVWGQRT